MWFLLRPAPHILPSQKEQTRPCRMGRVITEVLFVSCGMYLLFISFFFFFKLSVLSKYAKQMSVFYYLIYQILWHICLSEAFLVVYMFLQHPCHPCQFKFKNQMKSHRVSIFMSFLFFVKINEVRTNNGLLLFAVLYVMYTYSWRSQQLLTSCQLQGDRGL